MEMQKFILDAPRSLRCLEQVAQRRRMLLEPHVEPLTNFVGDLRLKFPDLEFQDFDPLDGGINAEILFLLEKPGPMTSLSGKRQGSGFISRDNDDPTAQALFYFMNQAEIARKKTILWNIIPFWNGTIRVTSEELRVGVEELRKLLLLLPKVKKVVLVGKKAGKAQRLMRDMDLKIFTSAHPSPKVRATNRDMWDLIPKQWAEAEKA
ncbi:uracil-DNA glycosylase [Chromobacterium sp. W521]